MTVLTTAKTNNPFKRVTLRATLPPSEGLGDWSAVNISTVVPPLAVGPALDWWVRGSAPGNITQGFRKANSANLFTVSVLNPTDGSDPDPGAVSEVGWGTMSWSDGPAGNVSGSTDFAHRLSEPGGPPNLGGAGFRVAVPAREWPDWLLLKVWTFDLPRRRIRYKASLDNAAVSTDEEWIDYYTPGPSIVETGDDTNAWAQSHCFTTEVLFAADEPGRTLNYDMRRTWQYGMSIFGAALFRAKPLGNRGAGRAAFSGT